MQYRNIYIYIVANYFLLFIYLLFYKRIELEKLCIIECYAITCVQL